ncbi:hypothetical protein Scep_030464 [Stephania cephalantha]|uniref:Uncharacterized protein n=1 Tax=Stephania cephalantha TaxID=152367 RepID=A0AAP0E7F8_9MAGN
MHVKLGFVEMILRKIEEHVGGVCERWVCTGDCLYDEMLKKNFIHRYISCGEVRSARKV